MISNKIKIYKNEFCKETWSIHFSKEVQLQYQYFKDSKDFQYQTQNLSFILKNNFLVGKPCLF
jgi:hypothetical protein